MGCNEDFSNYCADPIKASCVDYEGALNSKSELEGCVNQHDVNEDLYSQLEEVNNLVDVSELGDSCLEYETPEEGVITLKEVVKKYEEEICDLKAKVQELEEKDYALLNIEEFGLNFHCLTDSCGNDITTLKQLLQALINETCNI